MTEAEERAHVVEVARTWIRTPYHDRAAIKGVGVDCAMLLVAVYSDAGIVPVEDPGHYSSQWYLHHSEEKYLAEVEKYAHQIEGPPKPGDVVVYKVGRAFAHGGIVTDWPNIIHAVKEANMVIEDRWDAGRLAGREHRFYSRW